MQDREGPILSALSDLSTPWCVHVVATLRIADHIAAGVDEINGLASAAGCDSDSLSRVLRHLVSKGVFQEKEHGRFALNEAARELLDPRERLSLDLGGIGGRMAYGMGHPTQRCSSRLPRAFRATVLGRP